MIVNFTSSSLPWINTNFTTFGHTIPNPRSSAHIQMQANSFNPPTTINLIILPPPTTTNTSNTQMMDAQSQPPTPTKMMDSSFNDFQSVGFENLPQLESHQQEM